MRKIGFGMKLKKCIIIEHLKINIIAARTENFRTKKQQINIRNIVRKLKNFPMKNNQTTNKLYFACKTKVCSMNQMVQLLSYIKRAHI